MGINSGDGVRFFSHPDSLTPQLFNISDTSNIDTPGVWLFRVDGEGVISRGCNITSSGSGRYIIVLKCYIHCYNLYSHMIINHNQ